METRVVIQDGREAKPDFRLSIDRIGGNRPSLRRAGRFVYIHLAGYRFFFTISPSRAETFQQALPRLECGGPVIPSEGTSADNRPLELASVSIMMNG